MNQDTKRLFSEQVDVLTHTLKELSDLTKAAKESDDLTYGQMATYVKQLKIALSASLAANLVVLNSQRHDG